MISQRLTQCKQCSDILSLIEEIDCSLFKMSLKMYNNTILMLNLPIYHAGMVALLHYKRILTYKYFNSSYANRYKVNQIASKVKLLKYK